ncbi:MAG: hypothetical protein RBS19_07685 [Bacteroidales bacterium]|nr:hypothetical protein [Bacteroidales bacterium]MDY0216818.1 hypothetical protein [Bacteroidales bacterium]
MKSSGLKSISISLALIMLISSLSIMKNNARKTYVQRDVVSTELQLLVLEKNVKAFNNAMGCSVLMSDFESSYYIGDFEFNGKAYDVLLSKIDGEYVYSLFHHLNNQSIKSLIEKVLDQQNQTPDKNTLAKNHSLVVLMYYSSSSDFNPFLSESEKRFFIFSQEITGQFASSIFVPPCRA